MPLTGSDFRTWLQVMPDAIVVVDGKGTIVLANAQAEELFGYAHGQLLGEQIEVLVPASVRDSHPALRARYTDDPRPRPMGAGMELVAQRRDGSEFPAEISLSAMHENGTMVVLAAIRDVSERRRAAEIQAALADTVQRAERKFRGLLEAAPDAMVCVDDEGEIVLVNEQAERLFGYDRKELIGLPVEVLVPSEYRGRHPAHRMAYSANPHARPMGGGVQLAARRRDGSDFPAEISLSALETEEGPLVSVAVRDVSERLEAQAERERLRAQAERERMERQLHQSQRLESLGQLAGGVAHDFNNILGAITNYAHFVKEEIAAAESGDVDRGWGVVLRDVEQIQLATDRASSLTHQLLAFARREVVQPQVVDLNVIVENLQPMLRRTIGEHVDLRTTLDRCLPAVKTDPGQVEQVLVNLAVNARDAMPDGGQLVIETTAVDTDGRPGEHASAVPPGRYARLRVRDTGTGMDREVLERAFEPFFSTKRGQGGTGLGLATVYGIISQAGGFAHITSELGDGTTVTALFPVTDEAPAVHDAAEADVVTRGGETVLVVEDEDAIREVTVRILERNGYRVLAARDGHDALEMLAAHPDPVDLLLTDVVMPKMLGKELAERIVAERPGIRVIFMSGYAQPVLGMEGNLEEGVHLVEKPFSMSTLLAKVQAVLHGVG